MKSITVTTHRAINYGAVLQTYGLHKTQKDLGIENYLLDVPRVESIYEPFGLKPNRTNISRAVLNLLAFLHRRQAGKLNEGFHRFIEQNIQTTDTVYNNARQLRENYPRADFYISGSDQVLGLRGGEFAVSSRMLDFGPADMPRYTYAGSLGEYDWNEEEKAEATRLLGKFSGISVREQYAKDYLESFTKLNCSVNIDPVFLLNPRQWHEIAKAPDIQEKYILCYHLISNSNTQAVLDALKAKYHLPVVCLQTNFLKRVKADRYVFDADPGEFLGWIEHAEAVVTTSFHGTAFAAIFRKPFYTLIKNYKSQRMTDLLDMFNLSDRVIRDEDSVGDLNLDVDFTLSALQISAEREKSLAYLQSIIEQTGGC